MGIPEICKMKTMSHSESPVPAFGPSDWLVRRSLDEVGSFRAKADGTGPSTVAGHARVRRKLRFACDERYSFGGRRLATLSPAALWAARFGRFR